MTSGAHKLFVLSGMTGAKKGSVQFVIKLNQKYGLNSFKEVNIHCCLLSVHQHLTSSFVLCKTFSSMIFVPWTTQENVNTIKHSIHSRTTQNDPTPSHEKCSTLFCRKKRGLWRISSEYFEVSLIKREGGGGQAGIDVWSFNELTNWLLTDMRNMVNMHPNTHAHTPCLWWAIHCVCAERICKGLGPKHCGQ